MAGYLGSVPVPQATQHRETFTATAAQTSFATAGYTPQFVDVYLNGVHLSPADVTATNGSDVVLTACLVNDIVDVVSYTPFEVADQTFTGTIDITGELKTTTLGTSNFRAGVNAGNSIASGGNYNVAVGDEAGTAITTGDQNVAIGYQAAALLNTGANIVAIGYQAGDALTTGENNIAIGKNALGSEDTHDFNIAIGSNALGTQNAGADAYNIAIGHNAGTAITTGINNTIIGGLAGDALTDADKNTAIGYAALGADTKGSLSTAVGRMALTTQNFTTATNTYTVAVGHNAGLLVTTGINNTIIGGLAADALTDADFNVAIGTIALGTDTLGSRSVAVGYGSLQTQNFTTATNSNNVAVGYNSGGAVTTGIKNTLIGNGCGDALTDADFNVAVGLNALTTDTLGSQSVAIGHTALFTQNFTTATDSFNTAVGHEAGYGVTTGPQNTLIGNKAGFGSSTATRTTTGTANTVIGYIASVTAADGDQANVMGAGVSGEGGYTTLGFSSNDIRAAHGNVTWATVSDVRYKKDIVDSTAGLSFINALQPRTFKYKTLGELPETFRAYEADSTEVYKNSNTNHGFIAQEVKAAIDADSSIKDGFKLWDDRDDGSQEISEAALIPVLTKAVQELSTALDAALARITTLEG